MGDVSGIRLTSLGMSRRGNGDRVLHVPSAIEKLCVDTRPGLRLSQFVRLRGAPSVGGP
jgi:hypothetical protein